MECSNLEAITSGSKKQYPILISLFLEYFFASDYPLEDSKAHCSHFLLALNNTLQGTESKNLKFIFHLKNLGCVTVRESGIVQWGRKLVVLIMDLMFY